MTAVAHPGIVLFGQNVAPRVEPTGPAPIQPPKYQSAVTQSAAGLGKAPELVAAKNLVLSGGSLPVSSVRYAQAGEITNYLAELDQVVKPFEDSLRKAALRCLTPFAQLKAIIKKASIQTSKTQFEDPVAMASFDSRLQECVRTGAPIVLAMPEGGGKVPCLLKTGHFGGVPDFVEFLGIKMRAALVRVLREFHKGGAHMIVVPDTCLHLRDMQFNLENTLQHIRQLQADLPRLGITDEVYFVDTLSYLPAGWDEAIDRGIEDVKANIERDENVRASADAQSQSLMYIKNAGPMSDDDAVLLYAAASGHVEGIPQDVLDAARGFQQRTRDVTPIYMSINHHGIRGMELIERVVEGLGFKSETYIRASVHAKPGSPRPALSVFNQMAPVALLPMHSLSVRMVGKNVQWGLSFDVVARMNGWQVVKDADTGRFLFYEIAGQTELLKAA
jgi:hypothetical protein